MRVCCFSNLSQNERSGCYSVDRELGSYVYSPSLFRVSYWLSKFLKLKSHSERNYCVPCVLRLASECVRTGKSRITDNTQPASLTSISLGGAAEQWIVNDVGTVQRKAHNVRMCRSAKRRLIGETQPQIKLGYLSTRRRLGRFEQSLRFFARCLSNTFFAAKIGWSSSYRRHDSSAVHVFGIKSTVGVLGTGAIPILGNLLRGLRRKSVAACDSFQFRTFAARPSFFMNLLGATFSDIEGSSPTFRGVRGGFRPKPFAARRTKCSRWRDTDRLDTEGNESHRVPALRALQRLRRDRGGSVIA